MVTLVREGSEGDGQYAGGLGQEGYGDASAQLLQVQGAQAGPAQPPEH